jgi:hypothetical protein
MVHASTLEEWSKSESMEDKGGLQRVERRRGSPINTLFV